jgi:hypothetical protein
MKKDGEPAICPKETRGKRASLEAAPHSSQDSNWALALETGLEPIFRGAAPVNALEMPEDIFYKALCFCTVAKY